MVKRTRSKKFLEKSHKKNYITRDIMRCVKKNKSKIPKSNANNKSAEDGELVDNTSSTGPPVISLVKLIGEYTPNNTNATRSATKIPK